MGCNYLSMSLIPVSGTHVFKRTGLWRGALMFSFICAWTNDCVTNRDAGDLRHFALLWRHCNMCPQETTLFVRLPSICYMTDIWLFPLLAAPRWNHQGKMIRVYHIPKRHNDVLHILKVSKLVRRLSRASFGVSFVRILGKTDRVITAPHGIFRQISLPFAPKCPVDKK